MNHNLDENLVFISFVGSHDPYGRGEPTSDNIGPLLRCWKHVRSKYAILICTPPPEEEQDTYKYKIKEKAGQCEKLLTDEGVEVFLYTYPIKDPTAHEPIIEILRKSIKKSLSGIEGQPKFVFGISSGTPAQQTVSVTLVQSGQLEAELLQGIDPNYPLEDGSLVRTIVPSFIASHQWIKAALEQLSNGQFMPAARCVKEAAQNLLNPELKSALESAKSVLNILYLWSISDYNSAYDILCKLNASSTALIDSNWLTKAKTVLEQLKISSSGKHTQDEAHNLITRLIDIFASIERADSIGNYSLVVTLAWTLFECLVNYRCLVLNGESTGNTEYWSKQLKLDPNRRPDFPMFIDYLLKNDKKMQELFNKDIAINSNARHRLFSQIFYGDSGRFAGSVREARNDFVHRGKRVTENTALKAKKGADAIIGLFAQENDLDEYPLRLQNLQWLKALIQGRLDLKTDLPT